MRRVSPWLVILLVSLFPALAVARPQADDILSHAEELVRQGKYNEAEKAFLEILRNRPDSPIIHNDLGALYLQEKRYDVACHELTRASTLNPKEAAIQQNLGVCWFLSNQFPKAAQVLEVAERLDPEDLKTHYLLGYSLFMTGRLTEAEKNLAYVRGRQPEDENTLFSLVRIYRAEKQDQQAINAFQDLARYHSDSVFVHILMGESYDSQEKPAQAIQEYRTAITIAPEMPRLHFDLGFLLWEENHAEEAETQLRKELEINPDFAPTSYYLGEIALSRNDEAQAEQLLRRTLAESPGCVDAYIALGKAFSRTARYQEALREFQRALQLDPKGSDVHYWLAVTYRHLGDKTKTVAEMETFKSLANGRKPEEVEGSVAHRVSQVCMNQGK
jgi:tetratricopeptide (TPR) repeat protein